MSPTEDDLRRSLAERPDEPSDGVNASRVIALADERRGRRRARLLSAAAAVIVVGGVATGIGFLAGNGGDQSGGADTGSAGSRVAGGNAAGAAQGDATRPPTSGGPRGTAGGESQAGSGVPTPSCPSTPPSALLPGGGGTSEFGSSGPLFTKPVAFVTVCAYPTQGGATKAKSIVMSGDAAQTFAGSLENAPTRKPKTLCSDLREADQQTLVILAETKGGTVLRNVTTTINEPACAVTVTNGTALRYNWTWPQSLDTQLAKLLGR